MIRNAISTATLGAALALASATARAEAQKIADFAAEPAAAPAWKAYSDMMISGGQSSGTFERRSENGNAYLHVGGELKPGFAFPFAGVQMPLRNLALGTDWSAYKGVRFKARGDGKVYRFNVLIASVRDHDEHGGFFTTTKEWKTHEIPFEKMKQTGYGRRIAWNPKAIAAIGFHAAGGSMPYGFDIDDIELYR